jgi:excisionase family DNA binding protein
MSAQPWPSAGTEPDGSSTPENDRHLSTGEAARELGVSEPTIRRAIRDGKLVAPKLGRSFRITPSALARFRARPDQVPSHPERRPTRSRPSAGCSGPATAR